MANPGLSGEKNRATLLGLAAAFLWSTAIAGGRVLTEAFGALPAVALIHATAALCAGVYLAVSPRARRALAANSWKYSLGCGALFLAYILAFYLAVALASSHAQVVVVGIINYLWPALSLGLSVPLLGHRTRWPALLAANAVAVAGVALTVAAFAGLSAAGLVQALHTDWLPYGLALAAALSWGLYNNLSRRWGGDSDSGGVPLFIIALALLMSPILVSGWGRFTWSAGHVGVLLFVAVFPTFLAYFLWDVAERRGHHTAVNALAYGIPVLSTLASGVALHLAIPWLTWLGCLLVILGAALARLAIVENPARS